MKPKKIHQFSFVFFLIFVLSFPLSVSISQTSFVLSFLFSIPGLLKGSPGSKISIQRQYFPQVFWVAIFIYFGVLLSSVFHWLVDSHSLSSFWKRDSELHDIWMVFAIPLAIYHSRTEYQSRLIQKYFLVSFFLCLLVGIASIFTPYRLGRWISLGFQYPEGERLQHFAGSLLGRFTYLPIGLMNTHLTFGGIWGILSVAVFFRYFLPFLKRVGNGKIWPFKETSSSWIIIMFHVFGIFFIFLLSVWLLIWNQSRSIWLSILFILGLYLSFLIYSYITSKKGKKQSYLMFKTDFHLPHSTLTRLRILKIFFSSVVLLLLGTILLSSLWEKNWLLQRSIRDMITARTTENQRFFIYRNSFLVLKEHWLLGIGNGQFTNEQNSIIHKTLLEKPWLLYELYITPKGHAHHDLLHFWIVGGIISAISWLLFWTLIFQKWFESFSYSNLSIGSGALVLFVAGLFQCYMLDDEVALPFFAFVGLLFVNLHSKGTDKFTRVSRQHGILAFILVLAVSSLSLALYLWRNSSEIENVIIPKVHSTSSETETIIELEGCLTHTYGNRIKIRKQPFWIHMAWHKGPNSNRKQGSTPYAFALEIDVLDRDSFDQDKEYRAHSSKILETKKFILSPSDQWISIPNTNVLDSLDFPGNVRFRDFKIRIPKQESIPMIPSFSILHNCMQEEKQ